MPSKRWTTAEDAKLRQHCRDGLADGDVGEILGRPAEGVRYRRRVLGVPGNRGQCADAGRLNLPLATAAVARKRRERRERGESRWPGCGVTDAPAAALDALAALGGSALGPAVRAAMGASREHANGLLRHLSRAGLVARGRVEGSGVGKGCAGVRWSLAGRARWLFEARKQEAG